MSLGRNGTLMLSALSSFTVLFSPITIADQGIRAVSEHSGVIFFTDEGWDPGFNGYICLGTDCQPAIRTRGELKRYVSDLVPQTTYQISLKLSEYQSPTTSVVFDTSITGPIPSPHVLNDFSYLDWEANSHNWSGGLFSRQGGDQMQPHNEGATGKLPRDNVPDYLSTPISGANPTSHGFAFDIEGQHLSWRWGPSIFKGDGDSGLAMFCSEDRGQTFQSVKVTNGEALIPCAEPYTYFFRYTHPLALNNNPASAYIYTGGFTTESRVDVANYPSFTDGSANWMRYRHPVSHDGITAAVMDNLQNGTRLRQVDRYSTWVEDSPGNVQLFMDISNPGNTLVRNDVQRNAAGNINGQQQFSLTQSPGFGNAFSYGQVVQYEFTASDTGFRTGQMYNDFTYYTIGYGFGAYGDPRLNAAGKAGTTMWLSDTGRFSQEEYNAVFTQPFTTLNTEQQIDDFLVGHHLFHGIDPWKHKSNFFDDPDVHIGAASCGGCHFRDGRGSEVIDTPRGPRLPPPTYGVKLLESIEDREAGMRWDGGVDTVAEQVLNAIQEDHKVDPNEVPSEVIRLITAYTEFLTVPNRDPGSYDDPDVVHGDQLFTDIGCSVCHTPVQKTGSNLPPHLKNLTIRPYTDMKTWDLGEGKFRTAPLWGLGHNITLLEKNNRLLRFMHDGQSLSIKAAIQRHGVNGAQSREKFNNLNDGEKNSIVKFIRTL